jgi:hypothetical protein
MEITPAMNLLSSGKGVLHVLMPDGRVLAALDVPAGIVAARPYFDLIPEGCTLEAGEGLAGVEPRSKLVQFQHEDTYKSGADPDWQPSPMDALQRQLSTLVQGLQQDRARLNARERALASVTSIPDAAVTQTGEAREGGEVVE